MTPKTLGYLRTSTDKQEINNQRLEILEYARKEDLKVSDFIDQQSTANNKPVKNIDFIEAQVSSRKSLGDRKMDELFERLNAGDVLIVTELSRIGRSTIEVLSIVKELVQNGVDIVFIKQGLKINASNNNDMVSKVMITMFSLFAELERDLISHRTKEALRSKKASGVHLGKPKGTVQGSIYDEHRDKIVELLGLGLSVQKIAQKHLGLKYCNNFYNYVRKRRLKEEAGKLALKK